MTNLIRSNGDDICPDMDALPIIPINDRISFGRFSRFLEARYVDGDIFVITRDGVSIFSQYGLLQRSMKKKPLTSVVAAEINPKLHVLVIAYSNKTIAFYDYRTLDPIRKDLVLKYPVITLTACHENELLIVCTKKIYRYHPIYQTLTELLNIKKKIKKAVLTQCGDVIYEISSGEIESYSLHSKRIFPGKKEMLPHESIQSWGRCGYKKGRKDLPVSSLKNDGLKCVRKCVNSRSVQCMTRYYEDFYFVGVEDRLFLMYLHNPDIPAGIIPICSGPRFACYMGGGKIFIQEQNDELHLYMMDTWYLYKAFYQMQRYL